ncbi:MAG: hypothetical protein J1D77_03990 [Muribaculaceae bacterium]|nr:hypothetical protein [Muribaculaceae bacterium]
MAITPISDNAFVMTAICPQTKGYYGVTVDRILNNQYKMIWAFRLDKDRAKREGYDIKKASGSIQPDANYPGCPYCKAQSLIFCSCGSVFCWNGNKLVTCPKCGYKGEVGYSESINFQGGSM